MPKETKVQSYRRSIFDGIFPRFYDAFANLISFWQLKRLRREAIELLELVPNQSVLDLACGTGEFTIMAAQQVGEKGNVVGVDLSQKMLDVAAGKSKRFPQITYVRHSFEHIHYKNVFDAAIIGFGAHEVPAGVRLNLYKEAHKSLKPGGKLLVFDYAKPGNIFVIPFFWLFMKLLEPEGLEYLQEDHSKILKEIGLKRIEHNTSMVMEAAVYQKA